MKKTESSGPRGAGALPPPASDGGPPAVRAADWLAYLNSGMADDEGRKAFREWLAQSVFHQRAYRQAEQAWQDLGHDPERFWKDGDLAAPVPAIENGSANRRKWVAGIASGLLAASAAISAISLVAINHEQTAPVRVEHFATTIGEVRTIELSDGSEVTLGPGTSISFANTRDTRSLALEAGRAFFRVEHDADKPFEVDAGELNVTVLGTAFDVARGDAETSVAVVEGVVSVEADNQVSKASARLLPNQKVIGQAGALSEVESFDPSELSWRNGRLVFVNRPLSDVLAEINRYRVTPIMLETPALGDERITISLPSARTDQILSALEATMGVSVQRENGRIILRLAPDQ